MSKNFIRKNKISMLRERSNRGASIIQFNTHLSSTCQFHSRTTPPQPSKSISSTLMRQFQRQMRQFHTSVQQKCVSCCVELINLCWTDAFAWNWLILGAEIEWSLFFELTCWTDGCVELRFSYFFNFYF